MRREREGRERIWIGQLPVDVLRLGEAVTAVCELVQRGTGGAVFTPNVDHLVRAEEDATFRAAYRRAELSLADGMPVVWLSRALPQPLPERVAGADLLWPLLEAAAQRRLRVFLLGGAPGVAERAQARLEKELGVEVVGTCSPKVGPRGECADLEAIEAQLRTARPDLVIVALGSPKQELFIEQIRARVRPAVLLGLGAGLDFIAGTVRRAPPWISRAGLEWLFRLVQEPRRLWHRYLVRGPRFLAIALRTVRARPALASGSSAQRAG
jgi:N-acetylglucosaminyldiphosphoundecaprenol N-acetyl-beta-D-mannosaminyltransferase